MESFLVAVNAVVPFLFYISFGYFVRRIGLVDIKFLNKLNQMVFKAFFPILMFMNLYQVKPGFKLNPSVVFFGVICVAAVIVLAWVIVPHIVKENAKRGVIIQALYRSNFVLFAIPLTISIFGEENATLASMMVTIIVPVYNVMAILILEYYNGQKPKPAQLIKTICTNPMIIGALTGFAFFLIGIHLPVCVEKPMKQFSDMTTPLALFVLGGTLQFAAIRGNLKYLVPTLLTKMLIVPSIVLLIAVNLGFSSVERFILFTMFATPVATASYTMAKNMGGDGELAGELVVISTAVSVVTMFAWIFFMKEFGFL